MAYLPTPDQPFVVGDVSNKSLSIAWHMQGNVSEITHYTVFIGKSNADSEMPNCWESIDTKDAQQEYMFRELKPDTTYQFKVAANIRNRQSRSSQPSNVVRTKKDFVMPCKSPVPEKPTLDGTPTPHSIPLAWKVLGDTSSVTNYTVTYKIVDKSKLDARSGDWKTHNTNDRRQNCVITDLRPNTSYRFCVSSYSGKEKSMPSPMSKVYATLGPSSTSKKPSPKAKAGQHSIETYNPHSMDRGQMGSSQTAATHEMRYQTPPTPNRPEIVHTDHNSVSLKWRVGGNTASITHYTVMCKRANSDDPWITAYTDGPETHCTVRHLKEDTFYQCRVVANYNDVEGEPSDICVIHTPESPTYHSCEGDSSDDDVYSTCRPTEPMLPTPLTPTTHYTADDGEQEPAYQVDTSANTNQGATPPSALGHSFDISPPQRSTPPHVQRPTLSDPAGYNFLPLTWRVSGDTSMVTHYTITYRKADSSVWVMVDTHSAETHFIVHELEAETSYCFRVAANTDMGQSRPSDISDMFMTLQDPSDISDTQSEFGQFPTPDKPELAGTPTQNSIPLTWTVDGSVQQITHYTVSYRKTTGRKGPWMTIETDSNEQYHVIEDLDEDTSYQFRVTAISDEVQSKASVVSDSISTATPTKVIHAPTGCPPKPTRLLQSGPDSPDSLTLAWTTEGETAEVKNYSLTYRPKDRMRSSNPFASIEWSLVDTEGPEQWSTITNLEHMTSYEVCIQANTNDGQTYMNDTPEIFTTARLDHAMGLEQTQRSAMPNVGRRTIPGSGDEYLPTPTRPRVSGKVGPNSVRLTWNISGNKKHVTHYIVTYRKLEGNAPWIIYETESSETNCSLENLEPKTSYVVRVAANTNKGQSPASDMSDIFTTAENLSPRPRQTDVLVPPKPMKPCVIGRISHNSIPIGWKVKGNVTNVTSYIVNYRKLNGPWMIYDTNSADMQCIVNDLDSETSYQFRVAANTDQGQSPPSEVSDAFTTTDDPKPKEQLPPIPSKPRAMGRITHNSIALGWELQEPAPQVTHYTVSYRTASGKVGRWVSLETHGPDRHFTVEELDPETSYVFRITSHTGKGQSQPSETSDVIATTEERGKDTLPTPQKPHSSGAPGQNSVPLTWAVQGNTKHITYYTLSYRKIVGPKTWMTIETDNTNMYYTVSDLEADTAYQFRVSANSDTAQSRPSKVSDTISTQGTPKRPEKEKLPKPSKLRKAGPDAHDRLSLAWTMDGDLTNIKSYTLRYRPQESEYENNPQVPWSLIETEDAETQWVTIPNLTPSTSYEICISAQTIDGRISKNDANQIFTTADQPERQKSFRKSHSGRQAPPIPSPAAPAPAPKVELARPGTPRLNPKQRCTQHSLPIIWDIETCGLDVTKFTVQYRPSSAAQWKSITTPGTSREYTLEHLKEGTQYVVQIIAETSEDTSQPSEVGGPFKTDERSEGQIYREKLVQSSTLAKTDKDIPIYQVKLKLVTKDDAEGIQIYEFGKKPKAQKEERVILVVGATGAGKSTLINGLLNYVLGVEWEEKARFRLVEEAGLFENQHKSQTRVVTVYKLHHHPVYNVPYTVTIIDTPGFGDTEGIDKDKIITQSITHLFRETKYGVDVLHGVGFVAQASLARLTPTQKYIFDSILSLFGKDIADNIFMLITFSDSQKPPLLASTKEANIPYNSHFKFNNSALFANNDTEDNDFDKMFWKMGIMSFEKFIEQLRAIEGKSLYLTKEVLEERQQLEVFIEGIQTEIKNGLSKLEQYKVEYEVVKQHEADIERNRDFTYTVDETKMIKIDLDPGTHVTNCLTCNRTCHYPCIYANDNDKINCAAMDGDGNCTVCQLEHKCIWSLHHNVPYRFETEVVQVTKTSDDLKNRYDIAKGAKVSAEELAEGIMQDFDNLQMKVMHMADEVRKSLKRLSEIALRPNPLSTVQYLDILIESEKSEAKPGFQARINQLERVKAQAIAMNEMADEGFDPFTDYRDELQQAHPSLAQKTFTKKKSPNVAEKLANKVKKFFDPKEGK